MRGFKTASHSFAVITVWMRVAICRLIIIQSINSMAISSSSMKEIRSYNI